MNKAIFDEFQQLYTPGLPSSLLNFLTKKDLDEYLKLRFEFIQIRKGTNTFKLKIDNPKIFWQSNRTCIELLIPDQPFIIDCITDYLKEKGYHASIVHHPVMGVIREKGKVVKVVPAVHREDLETYFYVEIDKQNSDVIKLIRSDLSQIIEELQAMYFDFNHITNRLSAIKNQLLLSDEKIQNLINWLSVTHFVIFGLIETTPTIAKNKKALDDINISGALNNIDYKNIPNEITEQKLFQDFWKSNKATGYIFQQLRKRSRIYEDVYLISITFFYTAGGIKRFASVIGFFTASSYSSYSNYIPIVREKLNNILTTSAVLKGSFNYKQILHFFDAIPMICRFIFPTEILRKHMISLPDYVVKNEQGGFFSLSNSTFGLITLTYPMEGWSAEFSDIIETEIKNKFNCKIVSNTEIQPKCITYNAFLFDFEIKKKISFNEREAFIDYLLAKAVTWENKYQTKLRNYFAGDKYRKILSSFDSVFSDDFSKRFSTDEAIKVIELAAGLLDEKRLYVIEIERSKQSKDGQIIIVSKKAISLTKVMPWFSGFDLNIISQSSHILQNSVIDGWFLNIWYFDLAELPAEGFNNRLSKALQALFNGSFRNDELNSLITLTNLDHKQIHLLKSFRAHLKQLFPSYSHSYITTLLLNSPKIALYVWKLFNFKFPSQEYLTDNGTGLKEQEKKKQLENKLAEIIKSTKTLSEENFIFIVDEYLKSISRTNWNKWLKIENYDPFDTIVHKIYTKKT